MEEVPWREGGGRGDEEEHSMREAVRWGRPSHGDGEGRGEAFAPYQWGSWRAWRRGWVGDWAEGWTEGGEKAEGERTMLESYIQTDSWDSYRLVPCSNLFQSRC